MVHLQSGVDLAIQELTYLDSIVAGRESISIWICVEGDEIRLRSRLAIHDMKNHVI
jgi:hypothetical protein